MKKVVAIVAAAAVLLCLAVGVAVAESDTVEAQQHLSWGDDVIEASGLGPDELSWGRATTLDKYGLVMWKPEQMKLLDNDEYDYDFLDTFGITRVMAREEELPENLQSSKALFEYLKGIADEGDVIPSTINDMFCFVFSQGDDSLVLFPGEGKNVTFIFTNNADPKAAAYNKLMMCSLMKVTK